MKAELKNEFRQQRKTIFGNNRYWFHIAIWLIVIFLAVIQIKLEFDTRFKSGFHDGYISVNVNMKDAGSQSLKLDKKLSFYSVSLGAVASASMVYTYLLFIIPLARYRRQKRVLILGLLSNVAIWGISLIVVGIIAGYMSMSKDKAGDIGMSIGIVASLSAVITGYFFALYYFIDLYDQQRNLNRYQQIFTDKLQAETTFLKTQINPHFLFNTLNNIYSLALNQSDDAPVITSQLKELVQYMLEDCAKDSVPLSGEINFLKNYISLEKLRNKQEQVTIQLNINGETGNKEIAPLLLINFIENAFKHGVKSGIENAYVNINIYLMGNVISMDIANSKPLTAEAENLAIRNDGGIGIRNVCRRLEILYPNRHKLKINQSAKEYNVHLTIEL